MAGLPLSTTAALSVDKVISRSKFLTEEVREESAEEKEVESAKTSPMAASSADEAPVCAVRSDARRMMTVRAIIFRTGVV